ncbi:iron-siderophore ABC transporter substrate-binding protein [Actinorugispora endophytica]|uniref:Iron complex transport system substrate-binding protein n=1 Tax=Actinorugispora endophytica TaxID=1605990 RepID=A0A4R6UTZ2_9ACTN|nr:iron-siderophore ABC transporter substrate-binding protein [Actinorugispora endophytica]TDQ50730.1 iron complex transport system substrate-binding protein [Actinorugispora endophytica]
MSLRSARFAKSAAVSLLALALAAALAGCGGPEAEEAGDAPAAEGAFPVTIEHKYGETEIPEQPERVVTLGLSDQDAVLALGVRPVGSVDWFKEEPYGKWPWTEDLWGDEPPQIVGERDEYDMERIAALAPDVIIAQYSGMRQEQYETLSRIAPVVAQPADYPDYAAPWQEMARPIGAALGRADEMEALIEDMDERYARVRAEHPEFAEETLIVADSFEPGVYSAFADTDPKAIFFSELGFRLSPEVDGLVEDGANVAQFGAERLDLLDVDRLVWVTSSEESNERIRDEPLYQRLAVAEDGRDLFVPYEDPDIGAAFSFNTVLSIPYAIDQTVPLLTGEE